MTSEPMPAKNEDKEKKKLPPKRMTFVGEKELVDTVVRDGKALYAVHDRSTGDVRYQKEYLGHVPCYENDGLAGYVKFPSAVGEERTDAELMGDIKVHIRKWVDLEPRYMDIAALYVMFTWCYDEFFEVPYLRVLADLGSGKTRFGVMVMGSMCYRSFSTIGASTLSPMFRTMNEVEGTFILDEADMGARSDKSNEIVQTLNTGYMKGATILRSEMGPGGIVTRQYRVFGPKIVVSREHFKDTALESRCIAVKMKETTREDIPFNLDETLERDGLALRNKLLAFRFREYGRRFGRMDKSFVKLKIPARLRQLLMLISGMTTDPQLLDLLRDIGQEMADDYCKSKAETVEGELAEIFLDRKDGSFVTCKEIAEDFNRDRVLNEEKSPKQVGWYLRERMGLTTATLAKDRSRRRGVLLTAEIRERLTRMFSLDRVETVDDPLKLVELGAFSVKRSAPDGSSTPWEDEVTNK